MKAQAFIVPPPSRFVALFFGTLMGLPCVGGDVFRYALTQE